MDNNITNHNNKNHNYVKPKTSFNTFLYYLAFVHEQTCIYYVILVIGSSMLGSVHHQNLSEKKEEDILS